MVEALISVFLHVTHSRPSSKNQSHLDSYIRKVLFLFYMYTIFISISFVAHLLDSALLLVFLQTSKLVANLQLGLVTVEVIHGLLLGIVVAEQSVADAAGNKGGDADASVHPDKLGVLGDGDETLGNGRAKGVGEEVDTLDK